MAIAEAAIGVVLGELARAVLEVKGTIAAYNSTFETIHSTLHEIIPIVEGIDDLNRKLDNTGPSTKTLWAKISKGKQLIKECKDEMKGCCSCFNKPQNLERLRELDNSLKTFCQVVVPLQNLRQGLQIKNTVDRTHDQVQRMNDRMKNIGQTGMQTKGVVDRTQDLVQRMDGRVENIAQTGMHTKGVVDRTHDHVQRMDGTLENIKQMLEKIVPSEHAEPDSVANNFIGKPPSFATSSVPPARPSMQTQLTPSIPLARPSDPPARPSMQTQLTSFVPPARPSTQTQPTHEHIVSHPTEKTGAASKVVQPHLSNLSRPFEPPQVRENMDVRTHPDQSRKVSIRVEDTATWQTSMPPKTPEPVKEIVKPKVPEQSYPSRTVNLPVESAESATSSQQPSASSGPWKTKEIPETIKYTSRVPVSSNLSDSDGKGVRKDNKVRKTLKEDAIKTTTSAKDSSLPTKTVDMASKGASSFHPSEIPPKSTVDVKGISQVEHVHPTQPNKIAPPTSNTAAFSRPYELAESANHAQNDDSRRQAWFNPIPKTDPLFDPSPHSQRPTMPPWTLEMKAVLPSDQTINSSPTGRTNAPKSTNITPSLGSSLAFAPPKENDIDNEEANYISNSRKTNYSIPSPSVNPVAIDAPPWNPYVPVKAPQIKIATDKERQLKKELQQYKFKDSREDFSDEWQ